jgi:hypothetical protein
MFERYSVNHFADLLNVIANNPDKDTSASRSRGLLKQLAHSP